ncbi:MAG: hypothetical protein WCH35_18045, partial [Comamonadaceae bacterium]
QNFDHDAAEPTAPQRPIQTHKSRSTSQTTRSIPDIGHQQGNNDQQNERNGVLSALVTSHVSA